MSPDSRMFENMAKEQGAVAVRFPILPDDYDTIRDAVARAAKEYDMVVINAGSARGGKLYGPCFKRTGRSDCPWSGR